MTFIKYSLIALCLISMAACTKDFEQINQNPNAPLSVPANLLLPNIIRSPINAVTNESWGIGNIVAQQTAKIQFVNEDRYLWGERNGIWNTTYSTLRDLENLLTIARSNKQANYEAVGLIMKSWMFAVTTDCHGDIPYSQATQAKSNVNAPVYDAQEQIYNGILTDLKKANDIIGTSIEKVDGDILFGGNLPRWKKLANSLRLRYLLRISNRRNVAADMQAIVGNPVATPIFTSIDDNAALTYLNAAPNQFPLHTSRVGSFDEIRLSFRMDSVLEKYTDPRITIFARPTAATATTATPQYVGVPNGLDDVAALQFNGGPQNISRIGGIYYEDAISANGLKIARGAIMTYAELQFVLAEAAQKGLITGTTAKEFYDKGVKASFDFYGLTMPANYMTQTGVAFNASTALEQIAEQKWISLFFQGLEAWFDFRRTGLPRLRPGPANLNENRIPVRFQYPTIEQGLNGANRDAAVARQGKDDINSLVWWDK